MFAGANGSYIQAYNQRIVLHTIRLKGPVSRSDVARETGLTLPTVSTIVQGLIQKDLVLETGRRRVRRGKPPIDLAINPGGAYTVGLNLNRDSLSGVIIDLTGTVKHRVLYELNYPSPDEAFPLMHKAFHTLTAETGLETEQLWGVGVSFPGPLDRNSQSVNPPKFPGWRGVPVVALLREEIRAPIILENNATAAAIGEQWYGVGKTIRNFFYVFFGIGLGAGIILDGHPYRGFGGNAGRFGNTIVRTEHSKVSTYLDDHVSLASLYAALAEQGVEVTGPSQFAQLLEQKHPGLMSWLDRAAACLAEPLANIENYFDPEAIVLGGRMGPSILGYLIDQLKTLLPTQQASRKPYQPPLLLAEAGEEAAALGAATLPLEHSLSLQRTNLINQLNVKD